MLVVTRKSGESLIIGEDIEVVVLETRDGGVKIGINAPKSVKVYRKEIFEDIRNENVEALHTDMRDIEKLLNEK